jgi:osmotically-inducible protein OsmY
MNSGHDLKRRVNQELAWEPSVHESALDVVTADGVVTLRGTATSYAQRTVAERVAKRVKDVRDVHNEIDVRVPLARRRHDADIADAITRILQWNVLVPRDAVRVRVIDGWVHLEGTVTWQYQRAAAEEAVEPLVGIRGISNLIIVKPRMPTDEVRSRINAALRRRADLAAQDARGVRVETDGDTVVLRGQVHSWADRAVAEAAAWSAPGVATVEDELEVLTDEPELAL